VRFSIQKRGTKANQDRGKRTEKRKGRAIRIPEKEAAIYLLDIWNTNKYKFDRLNFELAIFPS